MEHKSQSSHKLHDVIVIGGGAIGLAAAYEVAKSEKTVMVLERNNLYNQSGSSGDLARMYRTMYTEDYMADLAKQSLDIWDELERDAGDDNLRLMTGLLNFGDPQYGAGGPEGTLTGPIDNLKRLGMPYKEYKSAEEIEAVYPFKNLPRRGNEDVPEGYQAVFAPDNGIINVPLLLRTLSRLAQAYGAQIRANHRVNIMTPHTTENGQQYWKVESTYTDPRSGEEVQHIHQAVKVIITAGAYINHILRPSFGIQLKLDIWELVANYWGIDPGPGGIVFPSMWFQFANDVTDPATGQPKSQLFYGFPALPWGPPNLARISVDAATNRITDPDQRQPNVISPQDTANVQEFVKNHCIGVDGVTAAYSLAALQTNVYDNMFVLDFLPQQYLQGGAEKSVAVFTAGWAMKFVPLLGRALRQMVNDGGSEFALPEFKITRHGSTAEDTILEEIPTTKSQAKSLSAMDIDSGEAYGAARLLQQKKKGQGSSMRAT